MQLAWFALKGTQNHISNNVYMNLFIFFRCCTIDVLVKIQSHTLTGLR